MKVIKAESFNSRFNIKGQTEIKNIESNLIELKITLSFNEEEELLITFKSLIGFRVLDEGDLSEFWQSPDVKEGWIFKILKGGWKAQESERNGFLSKERQFDEYLICGVDDCVSIFCFLPPSIQKL